MADDDIVIRENIITEFLLNTCQIPRQVSQHDNVAWDCAATLQSEGYEEADEVIPLITGSVAEFYIEPMLSCVGDVDIMLHLTSQLAIPAGYPPPTQLPSEFDSRVVVCEIVDSEFPGYVYLTLSCVLTECVDNDKYNAVQCERELMVLCDPVVQRLTHGPAAVSKWSDVSFAIAPATELVICAVDSPRSLDGVFCVRCLSWPPQAADWPTRHKRYGWPDSATVDRVVSNGCDVVIVAHPLCKHNEWMRKRQWRLSFSRAEIVLLNRWMPVQQIVYHLLRRYMKTEGFIIESADTLSNYHIKTLMLWACELKSTSWWTDDLNLVRISVELLHTLAVWLTDARCQHYFISTCNLFDRFENSHFTQETVNRLMSVTRASFCKWCIDSYIHKCAELCTGSDSSLLWEFPSGTPQDGLHRNIRLQIEVSMIVARVLRTSHRMNACHLQEASIMILSLMSRCPLTVRSCLWWIDQLASTHQELHSHFTAAAFLRVANTTLRGSLNDEMLDIAATTCLQSNDARRCLNARHSSVLSLSQAAVLMKVVVNSSRSTVQLIEIELSKAYLHRALRCQDSDSDSIYCLANVYLAALYYTTGQYQTAIDHCTLVTRSQDHSQCSSHVVKGELLPRIDDQVDSVLGLAVFYEYILAAALNEEQERRHVSVFTTELFAHYLHVKVLSVTSSRQLSQTTIADEIQRYRSCLCSSAEIFVTDVVAFSFIKHEGLISNDQVRITRTGETESVINHHLDTSKLVDLLQWSAVEHLTTGRELQEASYAGYSVTTTDFKAVDAYKRGQYQHCLQLSICNVRKLTAGIDQWKTGLPVFIYPLHIQLMDDDIVSLIGLRWLVKPSPKRRDAVVTVHPLSLSLYLTAQCQIKLRHSPTSLATTLDYVQLARARVKDCKNDRDIDQLLLKFVEQKILRYISAVTVAADEDDSRQHHLHTSET